ncbi:hypothetical protein [Sphingobacterium sp. HMA12]|uniref:hypothetical protein n=1 Tax=Sphingobacterium sp. HMA12 TaxID=2050894 RepID=UPI000CE9B8C0|nr:hypothetical protein [Sphingobacterium sp. HMA12]
MNLFPIKVRKSFLAFVSLFFSTISAAQTIVQEQGMIFGTDSSSTHIGSNNSKELKKAAFNLVPSSYLVQYAGSIGLFSAGVGWDYGWQKQWSTDFLLGYVPKYDTDRAKLTLTLRQTYTPFKVQLHEQISYHPLRTGVYLNTTLGKQFWYKEPDKYPNSYYRFSTRLRINIFVGQDFSYKLKSKSSYFEGIKFYYDLHTSDLYLVSGIQNKYLKFDDYIGLALGVKLQIRRK